jgi:hypothetical protein
MTNPALHLTSTLDRNPLPDWIRHWLGPGLLVVSVSLVGIYLHHALLGFLLFCLLAGVTGLLLAYRYPFFLVAALFLIAPFNYGHRVGPASIKLSELVTIAMLCMMVMRLVAHDREIIARFRRAWLVVVALALLGFLAVITAVGHPHVFNVRYEIHNYIAFIYALVSFRKSWWSMIICLFLFLLAAESISALWIRFVGGATGTSFFAEGGQQLIRLTEKDITELAGGRFRLAGTFGHKNILAGFYVLLLPLVCLEMLRGWRMVWLIVVIPALLTLALTDSMTGWSAAICIVILALLHLRRFDYLALISLLVMPVAIFALIRFGDSIFFRIEQLFGTHSGWGTVSGRFEMLSISQRLIEKYPWSGIGRNNFLVYGETYFGHAHNLFLMKIIEMGIPAGLAFIGVIGCVFFRTWKPILFEMGRLAGQGQYYRVLGVWLGCLGFLAMNFFDYSYANFSLGVLFMALLGLLMAVTFDFSETSLKKEAASQI